MKINNWTFDNAQKSVSPTLCSYPIKRPWNKSREIPQKLRELMKAFGKNTCQTRPVVCDTVVAVKRWRLAALGQQQPAQQSNHPWGWLSVLCHSVPPHLWAPREDPPSKGEAGTMNCHGCTSLSSVLHGQLKAATEALACQPVTENNKKRKARQSANGVVQLLWAMLLFH